MADIILVNKADDPQDPKANETIYEYKSATKFFLKPKNTVATEARSHDFTELMTRFFRYPLAMEEALKRPGTLLLIFISANW